MPEATHQLAAIMFTDIVGYTKLMGEDEQRAIRLLDKNLSIQKPLIELFYREKHDGRELPNAIQYSDHLVRLPLYYELDPLKIINVILEND